MPIIQQLKTVKAALKSIVTQIEAGNEAGNYGNIKDNLMIAKGTFECIRRDLRADITNKMFQAEQAVAIKFLGLLDDGVKTNRQDKSEEYVLGLISKFLEVIASLPEAISSYQTHWADLMALQTEMQRLLEAVVAQPHQFHVLLNLKTRQPRLTESINKKRQCALEAEELLTNISNKLKKYIKNAIDQVERLEREVAVEEKEGEAPFEAVHQKLPEELYKLLSEAAQMNKNIISLRAKSYSEQGEGDDMTELLLGLQGKLDQALTLTSKPQLRPANTTSSPAPTIAVMPSSQPQASKTITSSLVNNSVFTSPKVNGVSVDESTSSALGGSVAPVSAPAATSPAASVPSQPATKQPVEESSQTANP